MLIYLRLVGFTAGTLLYLFWLVTILGFRRPRNFERVFFFLALALFFFYSGSLLAVNAEIYYAQPPALLVTFAVTLLSAGLCFLPALIVHLHAEYAGTRGLVRQARARRLLVWAMYVPVLYFGLRVFPLLAGGASFDFLLPGNVLGAGYGVWLAAAMLVGVVWEWEFRRHTGDRQERGFHAAMAGFFALAAALVAYLYVIGGPRTPGAEAVLGTAMALAALVPGALLVYFVLRYNFLQIGRQKNLVYAVSATFLALLYLSAVRRVGTWLEPVLPPEATAAILLFVLVVFFEPLQRWLSARLRQTLHREVDRLQRLTAEIQQEARQGDLRRLVTFIERRVQEEFELAGARLELRGALASEAARTGEEQKRAAWPDAPTSFVLRQGEEMLGILEAVPHGASLSGETRGALEFLSEQLPAILELCRLIEEKLNLERDLAERERMALVGQMVASISHNLKNPLGAIKTILQVQLESPELPGGARQDCELVLGEIERLNRKLQQLLAYSRPGVRSGGQAPRTDLRAAAEQVAVVLRPEAERRGTTLELDAGAGGLAVNAAAEAVNDVLSNLLVNALEALERAGRIVLRVRADDSWAVVQVEDDGPGIPVALREQVLQPFFTTKPQGTGLGLAIVARRVAEMQGTMECASPAHHGRGTRFTIRLPLAAGAAASPGGSENLPRGREAP